MVRVGRFGIVALLIVASACSKNAGTSPTPGSGSTSSPEATAATSAAPSASSAPSVARCHTSDLAGSIADTGAAAGTSYDTIGLKNNSSAPCELTGYPGVSLVDSSGTQIGQPATKNSVYPSNSVTISGGASAYFLVGFPNPGNFAPGKCSTDESTNIRVYPPGDTQSLLVAAKEKYCPGFATSAITPTKTSG